MSKLAKLLRRASRLAFKVPPARKIEAKKKEKIEKANLRDMREE